MTLRPWGLWVGDRFEHGMEVEIEDGRPVSWRSASLPPEPIWVSPAFVNAHSHLEYRLFEGELGGLHYWRWLRELTKRKLATADQQFAEACRVAARENRATGVGLIAEHSDAPFSGPALVEVGIRGWVFQELITFQEQRDPIPKRDAVQTRMGAHREATPSDAGIRFAMTPHSPWSVDDDSLASFADSPFVSIHVAEHQIESEFFLRGEGPIAELYRSRSFAPRVRGVASEMALWELGLAHGGVQVVHACAWQPCSVAWPKRLAWCPRSNAALGCPHLPIAWFHEAAIGLGMDSAASSGPIDMFAELRAAASAPARLAARLSDTRLWSIATTEGARSIDWPNWGKLDGGLDGASWIAIHNSSPTVEGLIASGAPDQVRWL